MNKELAGIKTPSISDAAKKAINRIRALQVLYERTGFSTQREQFEVLMSLNDDDMLAASAAISQLRRGASNADSRR